MSRRSPVAWNLVARLVAWAVAPAWLLAGVAIASAAETSVWRHASAADFEPGTGEGIVVGGRGELRLGHALDLVADLKVGAVWDLVRDSRGRLVAATSSPGRVVRLNDKNEPEDLLADEPAMALSLIALGDGSLLVGLGPTGKILKITAGGKVEPFATLDGALYVWDLVAGDDGTVFAGTGPEGRVFRLDAAGKATPLGRHSSHVVSLCWSPGEKKLFAGTDAGELLAIDPASGAAVGPRLAAATEFRALAIGPGGKVYAGTTAAEGARPAGETPLIYRLEADGRVAPYAGSPDDVYSLTRWSDDGSLLAGAASRGTLRIVAPGRASHVVGRVDAEQVICFQETKSDVYLGTGNTGRIHRLARGHLASGTYLSRPIDAQLVARFGAVSWRGETPPGTSIALAVRVGDSANPDERWSEWSEPLNESGEAADLPAARYLQYRVALATTDPSVTPIVRSVTIRGRTLNRSPVVTEIVAPQVEDGDGGTRLEKLRLAWKANDPNKDELRYTLEFRRLDWETWVTLADDVRSEEYEWDATSVPEGNYVVRVTASDRASRAPDEAAAGVLESAPFTVDHEVPKLTIAAPPTPVSPRAVITARDEHTPIVRAAYSLDGGPWTAIFPTDGLFDQTEEDFGVELGRLKPGRHVLMTRATDAAGFTGSTSVVFSLDGAAIAPDEATAPR